ncbi:NAD-dependent protein deacetylase sirtuin-7 isoform X1 [Callorhinchus milii]|uniref:NAD-dependent protein deacetylase sirtuin-7 n=1 Tax=Callorhinchus milii TaxID=7868 RepID=V9KUD3_CALMI|nr:NAD-dependent protein deacetylase sirtuin-7 isoform X1 [Callorhinchus milii]|eukprot:gi/632943152/ref/XP_007886800.1/ PREDICTED: NAD-dependent protein deacetylase sirtuin-7 [Callorhinchus milii]
MAGVSQREARKAADRRQKRALEEQSARSKLVSRILKKPEELRTKEDLAVLAGCVDTVQAMEKRKQKREAQKRKLEEVLDEPDELKKKIKLLVTAVQEARYLVIYSGAGISTAASIPDYRGPNGVWTSLQSGRAVSATDLSEAEPTLTHMCIAQLYKEKLVQHVVSQNCDGLHLRSSLPRKALSELHGNMYIEVCTYCTPNQEYVRLFDVTERTSLHRHSTGRRCHKCANEMRDTIVHFGEKGTLEQPLNWKGAAEAAKKADVIICLGSSLKVLKKYPCLWCMNRAPHKRPKLYIVNLQWTPKDDFATLKIHAKCDDVMKLIMEEQGIEIPSYDRFKDPIFSLATQLRPDEEGSHTRKILAKDNSGSVGTILSGGWYGKGCAKGRRRKKITA